MTEKTGFAPAAAPHASTIVSTPEDAITAGETSIPRRGKICLLTTRDQHRQTVRCRS